MGAVSATWTPRSGGDRQEALVYLNAEDSDLALGPVSASARAYEMEYPAVEFRGLAEGETVYIEGQAYRVRGSPHAIEDGADMVARLGRMDE